jgi:hypothetical protein
MHFVPRGTITKIFTLHNKYTRISHNLYILFHVEQNIFIIQYICIYSTDAEERNTTLFDYKKHQMFHVEQLR